LVEVVVTCPECALHAKVLPLEDQMIDGDHAKCKHRINPLNCPLSVKRQDLIKNMRRLRL
jgi:hypothetical protein